MVKKVLVIHTWGIGDMLMFTPALQLLLHEYPQMIVDFLIKQPAAADVVRACSQTGRIYYLEQGVNLFKQIWQLRSNGYDAVIVTSGTNHWKSGWLAFSISAPVTAADYQGIRSPLFSVQIARDEAVHRIDNNLKIAAGVIGHEPTVQFRPKFWLNEIAIRHAQEMLAQNKLNRNQIIIGIHCGCGSGQRYKMWPLENYKAVIRKLSSYKRNIVFLLFSGPQEQTFIRQLKAASPDNCFAVSQVPLPVTAALIQRCQLMLANDSGLGHVANGTGVPVISIFGPTDPVRIAPRGAQCLQIRAATECSPCHPHEPPKCRTGRTACMVSVTPELVIEAVKRNLFMDKEK
ncbi:Hypothetical protein LUCI_4694 [Lucifera butyrica]|uniref:Glycosyl transferase family 9 n=1 Tax=Lucifera butyrica TaxID=1351585 RepID=A0A498RCX9_9FIRM|nr:glycosyltransferase family 9 protein [Lucifera butyrica]VBB09404.1 Hypothetical protein LUCI_4694 [Lucifera butyrica]